MYLLFDFLLPDVFQLGQDLLFAFVQNLNFFGVCNPIKDLSICGFGGWKPCAHVTPLSINAIATNAMKKATSAINLIALSYIRDSLQLDPNE